MQTILISTQAIMQNQQDGEVICNKSQAQIVRSMLDNDSDKRILMLQYENEDKKRSSEDDIKLDEKGGIVAARDLKIREVDPDPKKTDGENIVFKKEVIKEYNKDDKIDFNALKINMVLSRSWGQALKAEKVNAVMQKTFGLEFVNDLEAVKKSNSRCETARCFNESKVATPLTYIFDDKTKNEDREKYIKFGNSKS